MRRAHGRLQIHQKRRPLLLLPLQGKGARRIHQEGRHREGGRGGVGLIRVGREDDCARDQGPEQGNPKSGEDRGREETPRGTGRAQGQGLKAPRPLFGRDDREAPLRGKEGGAGRRDQAGREQTGGLPVFPQDSP